MADPDILAYIYWLFHGTEVVSVAGTNNVQTLTITGVPTGGTIALTYDGRTTTAIAYNATNAAVQSALEALPNIGTGGVVVTGGPWPATAMIVTFSGANTAKRPHPLISGSVALLTGGTPVFTPTQTTPGVNAKHDFTGTGAAGSYLTWCQSIGDSVTFDKKRFGTGRIGAVTFNVGRGSWIARVTPGMFFTQPLLEYATDPTPALSAFQGFEWSEGSGGWVINGRTFTGATSFELSMNLDLSFAYGDRKTPHDVQRGTPGITFTQTTLFDDEMKKEWNVWVYGTEAPTPGTAPLERTPPNVAATWNMLKKDSASKTIGSFSGSIPGLQVEIPPSAAPALGSGSQEVTLTGRVSRLAGQVPYSLSVGNQLAAYTV